MMGVKNMTSIIFLCLSLVSDITLIHVQASKYFKKDLKEEFIPQLAVLQVSS